MEKSVEILNGLFNKYNINEEDSNKIYNTIKDIFLHDEFQKRLEGEFYHHGAVMLGEHILEDAIVTYILCKKSKKNVDVDSALKIAMMHDLYTMPWQNSHINKKFTHKHGFSHPIEAVINSSAWFKEEFTGIKAEILVDGIVHHMFPLPVTSYQDYNYNKLELFNYDLSKEMPENVKESLIKSSNRFKTGKVSIARSKYPEGRIVSRADKIVSRRQLKDKDSILALVTGKNKRLSIKNKKRS